MISIIILIFKGQEFLYKTARINGNLVSHCNPITFSQWHQRYEIIGIVNMIRIILLFNFHQFLYPFETYIFLPWECLYFSIFFALHFCFVVFSIKEYSSERSLECITGYAMWHNTWNTYLDSRNVVHSIMLIFRDISRE